MMKCLFTGLALLVLCTTAAAQKKVPGYYVNSSLDTITGFFSNYREWIITPSKVMFTPENSTETITQDISRCKYIQITGGDAYETVVVKRLLNAPGFNDGDTTARYQEIAAFLRVVYQNRYFKVLEYNDRRRTNFFIAPLQAQPEELVYKQTKYPDSIVEDVSYRRQLVKYLAAEPGYRDPENQRKLMDLAYNAEAIEDLLVDVCGAAVSTARKKEASRFRVIGGVSFNQLTYTTNGGAGVSAENAVRTYNNHTSPLLGIGITIYQQRNFGKNFFTFSLTGYGFQHQSDYTVPFSSIQKNATQKGTVLELQVMPGRNFVHTPRLSWYLAPGLSGNLLMGSEEQVATRYSPTDAPTTVTTKNMGSFFTFSLQTGIVFNRHLGVWAKYKHKADIDKYVNYKNLHGAIQAGIEYIF